jgi:DsbC/DsbD-like thiol-disulfide interchange protein
MTVMLRHARHALILGANLVCLVASPQAASAGDASAWDGGKNSAARLIAGARDGEIQRAGVEVRLAPGWKTYWRYPGDSGIPPRFNFEGSLNVKSVTIRWPAPRRLIDASGTTIGYKHDVVFPLEVVATNAGKPVMLRLKLDYGVCEKVCIPAEAKAELKLTGAPGAFADRVVAAEALVPKPAAIGGDGALSVRTAQRKGAKVVVDVAAPAGVNVDLFAEGPSPDWALPVPSRIPGAPDGMQRFAFDLDGLPPNTKPEGATLLLTAVADRQAIEVPFRLD